MKKLLATVKRGKAIGTVLTPHRHSDGAYVVSMTRFEKDYIRVPLEADLPDWLAKGYRVRMSNPSVPNHKSPSPPCQYDLLHLPPRDQ